ncbi:glycosyltransferase [Pontimonas sp.]|nr:glycosyltransferase [Pontimonas sp.]MDA9786656.1 glycosyltransferase [Pontimonas sp.]
MTKPTIMVVLPSLGERLEYLARALASCTKLSEFAEVTITLVVPDVASEARVLGHRHQARVLSDPGNGMSAAINTALGSRDGQTYYIWLGDDDELVAEGIRDLVGALEKDSSATLAYGYCDYIDERGRTIGVNRAGSLASRLISWGPNLVPHPGTVVRLDALVKSGGFDESLRFAMDLDMFLRIRTVGAFVHRPVMASRFRWHPKSATVADRVASSREAMKVKKRYLPSFVRALSPLWNYPVAWVSWGASWLLTLRTNRSV